MKTLTILALLTLVAVPSSPVRAQQDDEGTPNQRLSRPRPLETVLQALTRNSGVTVIAEPSLAGAQADYPREAATPQNLEALLDKVAKSLPPGTVWKKAMLPASTRLYRGDDVAAFLETQERMFGRSASRAGTPATDTVEILGQKLAQEKAAPVVSTLGLKPVYVLVNTSRRSSDPLSGANSQSDFSQILGNFMNMDPSARMRLMQQFGQMMQNMSPDQRRQLFGGENFQIRLAVPPTGGPPPK